MTKSELIEAVAERTKITKSRAELVVNCVFDAMTAELEKGEGIVYRVVVPEGTAPNVISAEVKANIADELSRQLGMRVEVVAQEGDG